MTTFLNTNPHNIYVRDPERQDERTSAANGLLRVPPESEFKVADGRLSEEAETVPGVLRANSKAAKDWDKNVRTARDLARSASGPDVFPVPEDERGVRSGLHITGRDSGVPVAADVEPGDTKDGTGEDHFEGIAAVEGDEVTRGDVPKAVSQEPSVESGEDDLSKLKVGELRKLANERNVTVEGTGKNGRATKGDYVAALQAPAVAGGGGGVAVQTEEASRTEQSDAVASPESTGTLTTDDDPSTGK